MFPVAVTSKVTARLKVSEAGVAVLSGSSRTLDERSSGAVYSGVMAERVFGVGVVEDKIWLEEKSVNKGMYCDILGGRVEGYVWVLEVGVIEFRGWSRMLPGLISPWIMSAFMWSQPSAVMSWYARSSQTCAPPITGSHIVQVDILDLAIVAHAIVWLSRDMGTGDMTMDIDDAMRPWNGTQYDS